ncbi:ribonucleoside-triphosphate reductase, adenosylcobalamin-dependent [Streptomyces albulus]|nr:ribonucleoside-triphosphate reductase, adenosylcobalamin-dependent [Streptomyces noursei]
MTNWGPTGKLVYERTYSRKHKDGTNETWPETVERVVDGNLKLGDPRHLLKGERQKLIDYMTDFRILPAGRHLWASGVRGRQYLFNCHVSGWDERLSDHFDFTFMRLMEGGGVGANYSNKHLQDYGVIQRQLTPHIVCDPQHPDYQAMKDAGLLSGLYDSDWEGAFQVEDAREGWSAALVDLIDTFYRADVTHSNRVYDVTNVRAAGARLKTFGGTASGPAPLAKMLHNVAQVLNDRRGLQLDGMGAMEIDHSIAECVVSGGVRRSARMAIMRWDDRQIWDFLNCKADYTKHWTTNISVEVDNLFFAKVAEGDEFASKVLQWIAHGMLNNGEPGVWNSDYSNEGEPNRVIATNPCGEICLEPWENCNLGHVNLGAFVKDDGRISWDTLVEAHKLMTRFLIRATYGDVNDPKQASVLARNRRIGVGHFGFAAYVAKLGIPYSQSHNNNDIREDLQELYDEVRDTAQDYCHNLRIPVPVKLTTVAPTGTIAKLPGTTEGIHPIFSRYFIRRIRMSNVDPDQVKKIEEYRAAGFPVEPCMYAANTSVISIPTKDILYHDVEQRFSNADEIVESAHEISLRDMLAVQAMYQECWADNAVSYTANINPANHVVESVASVLRELGPILKGSTVFPEMSRPQSPYESITEEEFNASSVRVVADSTDEECSSGACPVR